MPILKKMPMKLILFIFLIMAPLSLSAATNPTVARRLIEEAKNNTYWKIAFLTGEYEQIVFMNISPQTNPNNEIGEETHPFDQAILIVQGRGKAILNGKSSVAEEGDLIFIPKGTVHNVINMNPKKELKVISFYSDTDIPEGTVYKTKSEEQSQ